MTSAEDRLMLRFPGDGGLYRERIMLSQIDPGGEFVTWWSVGHMDEDVRLFDLSTATQCRELPKPPRNIQQVLNAMNIPRAQCDVEEDYMPAFTPVIIARMIAEADAMRSGHRIIWGLAPLGAGGGPAVVGPAAGPVVGPAPAAVAGMAGPIAGQWIAYEDLGTYKIGDVIVVDPTAVGTLVQGEKALVTLPGANNEVIIALRVPANATVADYKDTVIDQIKTSVGADQQDLRVSDVRYEPDGTRFRPFRDAVLLQTATAYPDWPVKGGRTGLWCCRYVLDHGNTFTGRVQKFKVDGDLKDSAEGLEPYRVIAEGLDKMISYDQYNVCESAGCEVLLRYCQMVEDSHRDKFLPKATGTGGTTGQVREELHLYLGTGEKLNLMVSPILSDYLGDKLKVQSKIDKGRREAREERKLLAAAASGSNNNNPKKG